jgi:uncharacterized oxidoreductase
MTIRSCHNGWNLSKLKVKSQKSDIHIFSKWRVTDTEVRMRWMTLKEKFDGIDVLINNAELWICWTRIGEENDLNKQLNEIEINFNSPIRVLHYYLQLKRVKTDAVVVNVSSGLAYVPFANTCLFRNKSSGAFWTKSSATKTTQHKVIELLPPWLIPNLPKTPIWRTTNLKPMPPEN